jgi:hypothetical protein
VTDVRITPCVERVLCVGSAEEPWLVMALAGHCNAATARACLHPLLPLLGRVLDRMRRVLQDAPLGGKVQLQPCSAYTYASLLQLLQCWPTDASCS